VLEEVAEVLGLRCGGNECRACLRETRIADLLRNGIVEQNDPPDLQREKVDLGVKPTLALGSWFNRSPSGMWTPSGAWFCRWRFPAMTTRWI